MLDLLSFLVCGRRGGELIICVSRNALVPAV